MSGTAPSPSFLQAGSPSFLQAGGRDRLSQPPAPDAGVAAGDGQLYPLSGLRVPCDGQSGFGLRTVMGVPAPHATRIQPCSAMAGRDAALAHTIGSTLAADHNSCPHFNLVEERGETFRHRFLDGGILRPQLLPDCQKAFPSRQQVTAFGCTHTALAFEYRGRPHLSQRPVKTLAGASVMAARQGQATSFMPPQSNANARTMSRVPDI